MLLTEPQPADIHHTSHKMSPEDDPQTDRIPNIEHIESHNRVWNPIASTDATPLSLSTKNLNNGNSMHCTTATQPQPASNTSSSVIVMPKQNGTSSANGGPPAGHETNGGIIGNNNKNGAVPSANGNGQQQWSTAVPLLHQNGSTESPHSENSAANHKTANNNDVWSTSPVVNSSTGLPRAEKKGWKELPQDEEESRRTTTNNGASNGGANGNGVANGNGMSNGQNGHSDKLAEQDPLTGIVLKDVEEDEESKCGLGACQPKWARSLASTKCFMFVFLVAWVLQVRTHNTHIIRVLKKLHLIHNC